MFNVSIREYFSVLNVFIVCICNTAVFKLIPLLCTHLYSYMFSTVLSAPPERLCDRPEKSIFFCGVAYIEQTENCCVDRKKFHL
jgi:hypothetical protein